MILLRRNIKLSTYHLITTLIKYSRTLVIADTTKRHCKLDRPRIMSSNACITLDRSSWRETLKYFREITCYNVQFNDPEVLNL